MQRYSLMDLKDAYARNENITRILRERSGSSSNDQSAILIAYDLQAGSYVQALDNPHHRKAVERYAETIASVLSPLNARSLLEPGTGDATMLGNVVPRLNLPAGTPILGYDISWSRCHTGRAYLRSQGTKASLFVGELEAIPLPDSAVDVVFTSHAIEPNYRREAEILSELYRVAGRFLVLFEPCYELASAEARARMEHHGYCRGLHETAQRLGCKVTAYHLIDNPINPLNPTALILIEKATGESRAFMPPFYCPSCHHPLTSAKGAYYCAAEGLAYPILDDIPCLARHNAILATHFLHDYQPAGATGTVAEVRSASGQTT
jgi:uncharacterized protein YbaR (Trm112 family)